jgi:Na+-translocating ferredoxin:NAD+ oxidoreductase RnfE subunit
MRIVVFIIAAVIQLVAAAFGFLILLLSMNGYSEEQATPSLILYIALSVLSALALGGAGAFAAKRLAERTSLGGFGASAICVICSAILGVLILIVVFFASIVFAEIVRSMR